MAKLVTATAACSCTMGSAPGVLNALPLVPTAEKFPLLTVMDKAPVLNITPFGTCNVSVPPIPCVPAAAGPWSPGATKVKIKGKAALLDNAKLTCSLGGSISISSSGQKVVNGK
jgi:hypothetical protein